MEDILRIAAIVLLFVVPVLVRLFRRPEPAAPAVRPVGELDEDEDGDEVVLNAEIEQFLREAAGQRNPPPVALPAPALGPREPIVAEVVRPRRLSDSGSRHLETSIHADEARFSQRTSHLGEEVGQADEAMEGRIHSVFDHQLGGLADTSVGADIEEADVHAEQLIPAEGEVPPSLAAELAATFREPQSIRQAIILSEILSRPEHRWS